MAGAYKSRLEKRSPIAGSQIDTAQLDRDNTSALVATPGMCFELTYIAMGIRLAKPLSGAYAAQWPFDIAN